MPRNDCAETNHLFHIATAPAEMPVHLQAQRLIKMTERKENRNARRSRQMIREAFEALLKEKGFHKITVTDIVARAELNRSTF